MINDVTSSPRTRAEVLRKIADGVTPGAAAIDTATPDWVRRCRALSHSVILMSAIRQPDGRYRCDFFCTSCGKDRP